MGRKISARLPDPLHAQLMATAQACGVSPSDIIREALEHFHTRASDSSTRPAGLDRSPAGSHDRDACAQRLLAMLPPEVRAAIEEKANLLSYSVVKIITSLLIAQVWSPGRAAPQV